MGAQSDRAIEDAQSHDELVQLSAVHPDMLYRQRTLGKLRERDGVQHTPPRPTQEGGMESRAKFLGHAMHQQLIPFPFGLLATAVIFDVLYLVFDEGELANVAYWMIAAGVVGGLIAAPFGTIDWLAIPRGTRAKTVGLFHGIGNFVLLVLFVASWLLRRDAPESPDGLALALSFAGIGLAIVTGWLGGELVDRHAVGIDEGAHLNSPHSLSRRAASEDREPAPPSSRSAS